MCIRDRNIYRRETFNSRDQELKETYGWMTTTGNRTAILEGLKVAVRNYVQPMQRTAEQAGGIDVWDRRIIAEIERMVMKENGRVEAGPGGHDDTVLSMAIGWATKGKGVTYQSPAARVGYAWRDRQVAERDYTYS